MLILDNIDQDKQEIIIKDFKHLIDSLNKTNLIFFKEFTKDKLINLQNGDNNIILYFQEYTSIEKKIIKRIIVYFNNVDTNIYISKYNNYITIRYFNNFNYDCSRHKRIYCGEYIIIHNNLSNEINYYYNNHVNFCGDCYINKNYDKHLTILNTLFNEKYNNHKKNNCKNNILIDCNFNNTIQNDIIIEPIKEDNINENFNFFVLNETYKSDNINELNYNENYDVKNKEIGIYNDIIVNIMSNDCEFKMTLKNLNTLMLCNKLRELYGNGIIIYDNKNNMYVYDIRNN